MPTGPLQIIMIFFAAVMIVAVKFGPLIMKGMKGKARPAEKPANVFAAVGSSYQLKVLLNPTEKKLYKTLDQIFAAENLRVFAKVKLESLFLADNMSPSPLLSQLVADFLVMDLEIMEPSFVIMVEKPGAEQELRNMREICAFGRLPVITIPERTIYDAGEVREYILQQRKSS